MNGIAPDETEIVGGWVRGPDGIVSDEAGLRIDKLISGFLTFIGRDASGWFTLYRDPTDARLWEHHYPHGDYHGGGPPALRLVSAKEAQARYGLSVRVT